ncbi:MAG: hypothetical protein K2X69_08695, partial [Silvanigrellaceae bacterium]|nr:hypothetical protein [Silvanigrellaceae bacterium]
KSKTTLYKKFNTIHCVCKMHLLGGHLEGEALLLLNLISDLAIAIFFIRLKNGLLRDYDSQRI